MVKATQLEQFYVFPIDSPLTTEKRRAIDSKLDEEARSSDRPMSHKWLKAGEQRFLRILVDPVTIEVLFFPDRIEFFGAAPAVARLLFTKARRAALRDRLAKILVDAGFVAAAA